jgi:hypothetical protein
MKANFQTKKKGLRTSNQNNLKYQVSPIIIKDRTKSTIVFLTAVIARTTLKKMI